jgi:uncharacterized protein YlaN (UPF0358 family)
MSQGEDWEHGDLLAKANTFNVLIKSVIDNLHPQDPEYDEILENIKTYIMGYQVNIGVSQDFVPRSDGLTKEIIEKDLNNNIERINKLLQRKGGKSKKMRKYSKKRKSRRKTRRRRAIKRWSH